MTVRDNINFKCRKCHIVNIIGSGKKPPGGKCMFFSSGTQPKML